MSSYGPLTHNHKNGWPRASPVDMREIFGNYGYPTCSTPGCGRKLKSPSSRKAGICGTCARERSLGRSTQAFSTSTAARRKALQDRLNEDELEELK